MTKYKNFNPLEDAKISLENIINKAIEFSIKNEQLPDVQIPKFIIEIPSELAHGDFATNVAMLGAKSFKLPPRKIAEIIVQNINLDGTEFEKIEIAGPGFINIFFKNTYFENIVNGVLCSGNEYGKTTYGENKKINVEFVSANPTGPMHLGNARGGALGDCLASCMEWAGYDVSREFYVNDAGNQIEKFGKSLSARYLQALKGEDFIEFPEDGYQGEDIKVHAKNYISEFGDGLLNENEETRKNELVKYALPKNIANLKRDLGTYRISYDTWFSEKSLHEANEVMRIVDILKERNYAYEKDGTIWYRASAFATGNEKEEVKDEVLVRSNGIPTYFAADIAYHYNKFAVRGFETCINIWGADHHGHVARMKNAMTAIGLNGDNLEIVLMQLVRLVRDGEPVRMSKRTGKAITLIDLLEEIPIDSARFFFNLQQPGSQMEFDLSLAVSEDSANPVYYVQYAHARICSIISKLAEEGVCLEDISDIDFALLQDTNEKELIRHLGYFPSEIIGSAKSYDPARITRYVITLATLFHKFYNSCYVKGEDKELSLARLSLCKAVQIVICNALTMLKITIPEKM